MQLEEAFEVNSTAFDTHLRDLSHHSEEQNPKSGSITAGLTLIGELYLVVAFKIMCRRVAGV